jgi:hypothetical protein
MKYRSRTELASNILEAANGGATKTKIMYKASFSRLYICLDVRCSSTTICSALESLTNSLSAQLFLSQFHIANDSNIFD